MNQFEELRLHPGASIQLAVTTADNKSFILDTVYIGCLSLHSLIVAVPSSRQKVAWGAGINVAVTIVVATGIATFNSQVEFVSALPYAHLHISYPQLIQFREVRGAARVKVELPAEVVKSGVLENKRFRSKVLDISVSGLKLATDTPIGEIGDKLIIHISMFFAGVERSVTAEGIIKAHLGRIEGNVAENVNVYGVKFSPLDDESTVMLHAFVLNGLHAGSVADYIDG